MIGAAVGILAKGISNIINGVPFWYGMGKAAVIGGISGAISFGIGESVTGMSNFVAKAGLQAGMHGIKSGIITSIEGGSFMSGFAAGAVSSLISSSVEIVGHSGGYYIDDDYTQWTSFGARNPNLLKAMMISSGGLSGGISSSIAGGNFWSGAREGLITSGLNHGMHSFAINYTKHSFDREIDKAFGNKADKPVFNNSTEEVLDVINKVPTLKKFYNKFIKKFPKMQISYNSKYKGFDLGLTVFNSDTNVVDIIYFYHFSSESYRILSHTILHEFGHVNSAYHGFYFENLKKYNNNGNIAISIDEIYAHKFANFHGGDAGSPLNTPYYNKHVNALKISIWKIDAEKIALPSFN